MEPQSSAELDARAFIDRARRGELPREFILMAAQGFLPIPQEDLVGVLAFLATHEDTQVAALAKDALADVPARTVVGFARSPQSDPEQLGYLAHAAEDPVVLEAVLRNRATADETIRVLARTVDPHLQDVLVVNHERLLRHPEILESLAANPNLSPDVRRRIQEVREEFFEKKRIEHIRIGERAEPEDDPYALTPEEQAEFADLLENVDDSEEPAPLPKPTAEDGVPEDEGGSVWARVQKMTVSERVRCAIKGGRTERSILIKDRNRMVASAVVRSPRITESEVETFAGLRNIEEEALRIIGTRRDWMQKYPIMISYVRNPKAPIGVVLPLINRLNLRDLKTLSSDKGVPEAVRQTARKLYNARKQS